MHSERRTFRSTTVHAKLPVASSARRACQCVNEGPARDRQRERFGVFVRRWTARRGLIPTPA